MRNSNQLTLPGKAPNVMKRNGRLGPVKVMAYDTQTSSAPAVHTTLHPNFFTRGPRNRPEIGNRKSEHMYLLIELHDVS